MTMKYTRPLKQGMSGADVRHEKEILLVLGCYSANIKKLTNDRFGADTLHAVIAYQVKRGLVADGIIGPLTWAALEKDSKIPPAPAPVPTVIIPSNIGDTARAVIARDLGTVSKLRQDVVLLALAETFDKETGAHDYPLSLYKRGGNLYDTKRNRYYPTAAELKSGAKKQPQYYSNGRLEMMLAAVKANPKTSGADCSGGVIGCLRKADVVAATFDATADSLNGNTYSQSASKDALRPGDFVGKSQHIGLYVGGGYVAEWMGGAFGCQLTTVNERRGYCFVSSPNGKTYKKGKLYKQSDWTKFRKPKWYKD